MTTINALAALATKDKRRHYSVSQTTWRFNTDGDSLRNPIFTVYASMPDGSQGFTVEGHSIEEATNKALERLEMIQ